MVSSAIGVLCLFSSWLSNAGGETLTSSFRCRGNSDEEHIDYQSQQYLYLSLLDGHLASGAYCCLQKRRDRHMNLLSRDMLVYTHYNIPVVHSAHLCLGKSIGTKIIRKYTVIRYMQ